MRPMSLVTLVRTAPVTPRAFCPFMPLEVHAHHYRGIAEGIKKPSIPKKGRCFAITTRPCSKNLLIEGSAPPKHMPWAFPRDQTLIYFVASEKQVAGSDNAELPPLLLSGCWCLLGAGDPREVFCPPSKRPLPQLFYWSPDEWKN